MAAIDAAIAWHVLLQADAATGEDWERFSDWLSASDEHRTAMNQIEALWAELDHVGDDLLPLLSESGGATRGMSGVHILARSLPTRSVATALAALAASVVLFLTIWTSWLSSPETQYYATRTGERTQLKLADGSHITLNTNTQISVKLDTTERFVTLLHGEAIFDITKDPDRPFLVNIGSQRVRVVGTMFNILKSANGVIVTVARGIVDVMPKDTASTANNNSGKSRVSRLIAGQQLVHEKGMPKPEITSIDPEMVMAWQDGRLIYDDAPLSKVAEDLNRYFSIHLEPQDDQVRALSFSGVLQLDSEDAVVQRLEALLPITTKRVDDTIVMRLNAPQD